MARSADGGGGGGACAWGFERGGLGGRRGAAERRGAGAPGSQTQCPQACMLKSSAKKCTHMQAFALQSPSPLPPRAHPHPYLFAFVFYFVKHMDIKSVSFPIFASSARLTPRAQLQEARGTLLLFQEAQLQVSQPQEVRRTMLQQARRRIPGKWQPRSSGFAIFARWMDGRSGHWKPRAAWRLVA